jgi:hypothetical protein
MRKRLPPEQNAGTLTRVFSDRLQITVLAFRNFGKHVVGRPRTAIFGSSRCTALSSKLSVYSPRLSSYADLREQIPRFGIIHGKSTLHSKNALAYRELVPPTSTHIWSSLANPRSLLEYISTAYICDFLSWPCDEFLPPRLP